MYELSIVSIEKSAPKSLIIQELSKLMGVSLKQAKEHLEFLIKDQQPIDLRIVEKAEGISTLIYKLAALGLTTKGVKLSSLEANLDPDEIKSKYIHWWTEQLADYVLLKSQHSTPDYLLYHLSTKTAVIFENDVERLLVINNFILNNVKIVSSIRELE